MKSSFSTYLVLLLLPVIQLVAQSADTSYKLLDELSELAEQKMLQHAEEMELLKEAAPDSVDRYAKQHIEQQTTALRTITLQLKKARIFTKNSDYSSALQIVQRLESQITEQLASDRALEAVLELSGELQVIQHSSHHVWYEQVRATVDEARTACLQAKTSSDLDPLLIKVSALEIKRPSSSNNVVVSRGSEMLRGTVSTLQTWMRYLDQHDAGNAKAANDMLKQLERNTSNYPLLSQQDLASRWFKVVDPQNASQVATSILARISSPEDLNEAIDALEAAGQDPKLTKQEYFSTQVIPRLISYKRGFEALQAGDINAAQAISKSLSSYSGRSDVQPFFEVLKTQLTNNLIKFKVEESTGRKIDPEKAIEPQIDQILNELWKAEQVSDIQNILLLQIQSKNSQYRTAQYRIRSAVGSYLTAQQFESANDPVAAYVSYRTALSNVSSEYPLSPLAVAAMNRIRESNPDRIQQFDESTLIQEITKLRDEMREMNASGRMRRY